MMAFQSCVTSPIQLHFVLMLRILNPDIKVQYWGSLWKVRQCRRLMCLGEIVCSRFLALAKAKLYWMVPKWGRNSVKELPVETQFLLLELPFGQGQTLGTPSRCCYALLLPLVDEHGFRVNLRPPEDETSLEGSKNIIIVRIESGDESVRATSFDSVLYCAAGPDPFSLIEHGVVAAAKLSGTAKARTEKETPVILDRFGYCTWDASYTAVCPADIEAGLTALAAGKTPARFLIIDDGWQQTGLDYDVCREVEVNGGGGVVAAGRKWTLEQVQRRRASAELIFQDLQITAPLRAMERDKAVEEARKATVREMPPRLDITFLGRWMPQKVLDMLSAAQRWAEKTLMRFLQRVLETTHSGTFSIEVWASLATGPFRQSLLRFYAAVSCHSRRLLSVRANGKFTALGQGADAPLDSHSDSFGDVVQGLKARCRVDHVLCWHAMAGYWSGLMPGAPDVARFDPVVLFPRPSPGTLEVDPSMRWVHPAVVGVGIPRREREFHRALHSYLRSCGVDGVKVDVEGTMAMFGFDSGGYAAISRRFHDSVEDSVNELLPGNLQLNSMCCSMDDLYNLKHSNIARVGEDFYPTIKASHWAHVANAAFTTLMVGPLANPDWDMMHSVHDSAALHGAARAVSGGLVVVSDPVGAHDFALLRRLVLPDGGVLRARLPGRPTLDCLFSDVSRDGKTVLKVWNLNDVTGVIGAFNVQGATWDITRRNYWLHDPTPPELTVHVKPEDVPYLFSEIGKFVLYSDALREARLLGASQAWKQTLHGGGSHDVFVVSPVFSIAIGDLMIEFAPIGLVNMLNGGGAVKECYVKEGCIVQLTVYGAGQFKMYSTLRPKSIMVNGVEVGFVYPEEVSTVSVGLDECAVHRVEVNYT